MLQTRLSGDFSLDMQSVQRLKHTANADPEKGLEAGAKQFEAMFLQKMLKVMHESMPKSDLMHSNQTGMTQSLMDRQWAQTLSERGIGLADMLTRQLQRSDAPAASSDQPPPPGAAGLTSGPLQRAGAAGLDLSQSAREVAGFEQATPLKLEGSTAISTDRGAARPSHWSEATEKGPLIENSQPGSLFGSDAVYKGEPLIELDPQASITADSLEDVDSETIRDFVDCMGDAAQTASERTGLPQRLILAQAALETGWGRYEVQRDNGQPSYNVFNIKATGWQGAVADADTTEYVNGRPQSERAGFRAYDSYEQAFGDYARLLSESPRYAGLAGAADGADAARVLQDSGYATDPNYADKLVSVMNMLPQPSRGGVEPLIDMDQSGPLFVSNP